MSFPNNSLQAARPKDTRRVLGQWLRLARQRLEWTQPMLSSKSGVPVATLSRLEREGAGGTDTLLRVLQALGELDGFHAYLQERLRLASLPRDLSELPRAARPRQRVRRSQPKPEAP
jgi:transcriptional regulator with XRE-family HTH domain